MLYHFILKKTFKSKPDMAQAAYPVGWQDGTLPRIHTAPGLPSKGGRRGWLSQAGAAPTFAAPRPAASLQCLKPPGLEDFNCSLINCFISATFHYPTPSNITKLSSDVKAA